MKSFLVGKKAYLKWFILFTFSILFLNCRSGTPDVSSLSLEYIAEWKQFYPSEAFSSGDKLSAFRFEDFSRDRIERWLHFNKHILAKINGLGKDLSNDDRIDMRLLKRQVKSEIDRWEIDQVHLNSAAFYSGFIAQAMTYVLGRQSLSPEEESRAVLERLAGIRRMCLHAMNMLQNGRPAQTNRALSTLKSSAIFIERNLPEIAKEWSSGDRLEIFAKECQETASQIHSLTDHIENKVIPHLTLEDTLGKANYAPKLAIFADEDLKPEQMEDMALKEINQVRQIMADVSTAYWKEAYPDKPLPSDFETLLGIALQDMERDRFNNQKDFLNFFTDLVNRAEAFIRDNKIATLPEKQAVIVQISPEHFPMAAVGGTYSVGPFDPEASTIFYLPSVPDSSPLEAKDGFYRSFNNHFNTMIVTHEIFPGHHLQAKIASKNPRLVRSLFGDGLNVEGWATLCEVIALDAGWNGYNKLDRLAHLRKRLENATRAYTSVQVHANSWDKEKVTEFATKTGLLAPQFAINLWNRVIDSPLQLCAYFLGFQKFSVLYESEKKRLGDRFQILEFSDRVLEAGAIPIDELPIILKRE